jgi:hypothetical protein
MSVAVNERLAVVGNVPLLKIVLRLRHVTGFATVYGENLERRSEIFARLWHVRRVLAVTRMLTPHWPDHDQHRARWLAWLHDVNRWPFAHNAERGLFNQATNTKAYFAGHPGLMLDSHDRDELVEIQSKNLDCLSPEGELVLLADAITGVIEDPLMLITGLNVRPEVVPRALADAFGFEHRADPWRQRALPLTRLIHASDGTTDVRAYQASFRRLFLDQVRCFIAGRLRRHGVLDARSTMDVIRKIKTDFICPVVFPINNDLVCRGEWLRREVMPWYLTRYGPVDLVDIAEEEFVRRVVSPDGSPFTPGDFIPDLDAVCRSLPESAFLQHGHAACRPRTSALVNGER